MKKLSEAVASFAEVAKMLEASDLMRIDFECRPPPWWYDAGTLGDAAKAAQSVNLPRFRTKELPHRLGN